MRQQMTRKQFLVGSSGTLLAVFSGAGLGASTCFGQGKNAVLETEDVSEEESKAVITRIKMVTIGAPDLGPIEDWYVNWLGHKVVERGEISENLAQSWGAPKSAGRSYILMQPESGSDVFVRAVHVDSVADYRPMTTTGWNSFEIIVDDVYALNEKLKDGPFEIIGNARPLGTGGTIHAMQVIGPADDVLYLTCELGDRETSNLPIPGSFVDRTFIVVLAGSDADEVREFYVGNLSMKRDRDFDLPIGIISRAQGLPEDHSFPLRMVMASERGNMIEIDGYPESAGQRPRAEGQLPPGNALVTFSTTDIDAARIDFIHSPVIDDSLAYGGRRSASFVGPAGEITELIEERR